MQNLTNNKWLAVRSFITYWLKDNTLYCNVCGNLFDDKDLTKEGHWNKCCDTPQIGRNADHCMGVVKQNKELKKTRANDTASFKNKAMRWGISMPLKLLEDLEKYFKTNHDEKLFNDNKELHAFMKEFPAFCIAKKI
ncbi:MAG: hypothetical protein GY861_15690 [bacterium]|nr:hypothetical protein [bacterium]